MRKKLIGILAVLGVLCLSAGVFSACTNPPDDSGNGDDPPVVNPPAPVDPDDPDDPTPQEGISTVTVGNVRIQLLSPTLLRVEEKGVKGFEDRPSYIVSNRLDWETVPYTLEEGEDEAVISTAAYKVHVPAEAGAEGVYVTNANGDSLWSFTGMTGTNVYLPSPSDELTSWYFTDSPRIIPSDYGYSVNASGGMLQDWDFGNDATDAFVFLPQGDYRQFCEDYTSLTGKSEMVTLQMLGFWDSRWYAYSAETALQQIRDYTDRGYSIDVLVVDTDWRTASSGTGYEINKTLFPDMAGFLEDCHELGVNVAFNDHPEPVTSGNGLDKEEVAFRNENLTLILSLGLDYWWYDRNWSVALNSCDPDISVYAFGMYAYNWITTDYLESITDLNEYAERALIMGNVDGCLHGKWNYASDLSAHRYSIQWTGDIGADTTALSQEIYAAVFGGAEVGLPYMSSDIGGHTQAVSDSMYSRWIQYGALSTICRVHCTNASYIHQEGRMPWLFGETAEEVAHTYLDMRYRLLPLYYSLSHENYESGLPVMRRLDINYPQYVESQRSDEYLLGDYILVAPIAEAMEYKIAEAGMFTHDEGGNAVAGLKAEYYNNMYWSGTPVVTKTDPTIDFDWGQGGPAGVGADKYSVKWTGNFTVGAKKAQFIFFADDGIEVYIDGTKVVDGAKVYDQYLPTPVYEAGTTHSIEVRYFEDGSFAHVYMYCNEQPAAGESVCYNTRTVFLPEGTWIDVWTGTRYSGPRTITVTHPLETSPVFVREGALITLAQNMKNTSEKDWSEMALDVYPSKNFSAKTTLYEDDVTSVAYRSGKFRTTGIEMSYDGEKDAVIVKIGAAQGEFAGARAFEERLWNVRIHRNPDWGEILTVRVNGKLVSVDEYKQSASAKPFAFSGAAADGDIAEFLLQTAVNKSYEIEIRFASAQNSAVNGDYDDTELNFTLSSDEAGDSVDLTAAGTIGWTSFGDASVEEEVNMAGAEQLFEYVGSYDSPWITNNAFLFKYYTNGTLTGDRSYASGISSQKDFSLEIKTAGKSAYYVLYVGGNRSTAKLTVRDRAGNAQTVTFGDIEGRYLRRVVIACPDDTKSTLYVTYSMLASEPNGTGTFSSLTLLCGYASETLPEVAVRPASTLTARIISSSAPDSLVNLSECGKDVNAETLDWMQFSDKGTDPERRTGGTGIGDVVFQAGQGFFDYPATLSYTDGDKIVAHTGTRNGTCTPGTISINFNISPNVRFVRLYTGAWRATNTVEVYNRNGKLLTKTDPFTAGDRSVPKVVTIAVNTEETDSLIVIIRSSNEGTGGNVSLAAVALLGSFAGTPDVTLTAEQAETVSGGIDLTERGTQDWAYAATDAQKENGNGISAFTYSTYHEQKTDFGATFSYTDGPASASGLAGYVNCDFARFQVTVNENTSYIELYVSVFEASAGLTVLDESGRALLRTQVYEDANSSMDSVRIRIAVDASAEETLTFVFCKGGTGAGRAGIAAVTVK